MVNFQIVAFFSKTASLKLQKIQDEPQPVKLSPVFSFLYIINSVTHCQMVKLSSVYISTVLLSTWRMVTCPCIVLLSNCQLLHFLLPIYSAIMLSIHIIYLK